MIIIYKVYIYIIARNKRDKPAGHYAIGKSANCGQINPRKLINLIN